MLFLLCLLLKPTLRGCVAGVREGVGVGVVLVVCAVSGGQQTIGAVPAKPQVCGRS